jgi:hypothetical protein
MSRRRTRFRSSGSRALSRLAVACSFVVVLGVAGCAPDSGGAARAAEDFRQAVADGDPSAACSMLTEHTREEAAATTSCEEELESLELPSDGNVVSAESYGREAIVEFEDDTVFLTVSGSGWQVTGAGCEEHDESSYNCEVGG